MSGCHFHVMSTVWQPICYVRIYYFALVCRQRLVITLRAITLSTLLILVLITPRGALLLREHAKVLGQNLLTAGVVISSSKVSYFRNGRSTRYCMQRDPPHLSPTGPAVS